MCLFTQTPGKPFHIKAAIYFNASDLGSVCRRFPSRGFQEATATEAEPRGRATTCWGDYTSHLAWGCLWIPPGRAREEEREPLIFIKERFVVVNIEKVLKTPSRVCCC